MAYNEETAQRIRNYFHEKGIAFTEKKMFMGVCFMVNDKICAGTHTDKKAGTEVLLCRIGELASEAALEKEFVEPMSMAGRVSKGFVWVAEEGFGQEKDLAYWLQLCLSFNPMAKRSK